MDVLRFQQLLNNSRPVLPERLRRSRIFRDNFRSGVLAGLLCLPTLLSSTAADNRGQGSPQVNLLREFRPIGGTGNNLFHRNLNAVPNSPEIALTPLHFAEPKKGEPQNALIDGPNPRDISNAIAGSTGDNGQDAESTDPTFSAWLYVFGQFLDHDISLEATPLTNAEIDIPIAVGDSFFKDGGKILMTRSTRDPKTNTIINTVAGYLDLSQLYGSTVAMAASLRQADGTLKTSNGGQALPIVGTPPNDQFISGDARVMENPELTATTTLFMREHNLWVRLLKAQNPGWTGDQLYNMAKAITTAEYQNIIYTEYLPALIGPVLGPYPGYNPDVNAQVTQEFAVGAFRVGHSQVSGDQTGIDNTGAQVFTEGLEDAFFNTAGSDIQNGINPLIRNLGTDPSQATDPFAVDELRNLLFAGLVGGGVDKMDLIAIDIQRERDAGLGTLNATRVALGLPPYRFFTELTSDSHLQKKFADVFHDINQVDLFMGGLAEDHARGAVVGPTFQAIIARQFAALRAGDRFYWQNQGFNASTASMIANTRLSDLIIRNADTPNLQANVFITKPLPNRPPHQHFPPHTVVAHGRARAFLNDGH